jgi:hypothetical protein
MIGLHFYVRSLNYVDIDPVNVVFLISSILCFGVYVAMATVAIIRQSLKDSIITKSSFTVRL